MRHAVKFCLLVSAGLFILTGCGGNKIVAIQDLEAPKWVLKGSSAFGQEKERAFYGIGSAVGIKNTSLLRSTADNRARNEIAKVIEVYSASLSRDYAASTMGGDVNTTSEEQHVEQAIKTVTTATLSGVEIIDHWQNPKTGELFSLAKLDLEKVRDNIEKAKELNAKAKEYIKQNAERLHEKLEKEEEKRNAEK